MFSGDPNHQSLLFSHFGAIPYSISSFILFLYSAGDMAVWDDRIELVKVVSGLEYFRSFENNPKMYGPWESKRGAFAFQQKYEMDPSSVDNTYYWNW